MNIKVLFTLALSACTLMALDTNAQSMKSGIKGGLNVSNLYVDDVEDEDARFGFHAGIFAQYPIGEFFAIQPELLYSNKGSKATYDVLGLTGDYQLNLNYLDLPVLAVFKLGEAAEIHAGVYLAYLLAASTSTEGDFGDDYEELDKDHFNSFDFGLVGGFAMNFNPVTIGLRYNYGLNQLSDSDIADTVLGDSKNSLAQIYVAFNFSGE